VFRSVLFNNFYFGRTQPLVVIVGILGLLERVYCLFVYIYTTFDLLSLVELFITLLYNYIDIKRNGIILEIEKRIDDVSLFCSYSWQELNLTKLDCRCQKSKTTFKK